MSCANRSRVGSSLIGDLDVLAACSGVVQSSCPGAIWTHTGGDGQISASESASASIGAATDRYASYTAAVHPVEQACPRVRQSMRWMAPSPVYIACQVHMAYQWHKLYNRRGTSRRPICATAIHSAQRFILPAEGVDHTTFHNAPAYTHHGHQRPP